MYLDLSTNSFKYIQITQAKQISLSLLDNFYPMMSYRRVQKERKATNYYIYTVRSLVMVRAISWRREGLKQSSSRRNYEKLTSIQKDIVERGKRCVWIDCPFDIERHFIWWGENCEQWGEAALHRENCVTAKTIAKPTERSCVGFVAGERGEKKKKM